MEKSEEYDLNSEYYQDQVVELLNTLAGSLGLHHFKFQKGDKIRVNFTHDSPSILFRDVSDLGSLTVLVQGFKCKLWSILHTTNTKGGPRIRLTYQKEATTTWADVANILEHEIEELLSK